MVNNPGSYCREPVCTALNRGCKEGQVHAHRYRKDVLRRMTTWKPMRSGEQGLLLVSGWPDMLNAFALGGVIPRGKHRSICMSVPHRDIGAHHPPYRRPPY